MFELEEKVLEFLEQPNILGENDKMISALSGGADSAALLSCLSALKERLGFKLYAVHVNHNLRGGESDGDQAYAEKLCEELGVPIKVYSIDVKGSLQKHRSVEETARDLRYKAFEEAAAEIGGKIATAHNSNDNAETVLLNMLRGTGLKGLCGIPPKRGIFIRPLLYCTRAEIEDYCREKDLKFVTDKTNFSTEYTRNKIRLEIIPELLKINPSLYEGVGRMTKNLISDSEFLENSAKNALESAKIGENTYSAEKLAELPDPIFTRTISTMLKNAGIEPSALRINGFAEIIRLGKGKINIEKNKFAVVEKGKAEVRFIRQNYRKNKLS